MKSIKTAPRLAFLLCQKCAFEFHFLIIHAYCYKVQTKTQYHSINNKIHCGWNKNSDYVPGTPPMHTHVICKIRPKLVWSHSLLTQPHVCSALFALKVLIHRFTPTGLRCLLMRIYIYLEEQEYIIYSING